MQLLRFYSAQSAAQLPCEVICYLYTISLEILDSDQTVPCSPARFSLVSIILILTNQALFFFAEVLFSSRLFSL